MLFIRAADGAAVSWYVCVCIGWVLCCACTGASIGFLRGGAEGEGLASWGHRMIVPQPRTCDGDPPGVAVGARHSNVGFVGVAWVSLAGSFSRCVRDFFLSVVRALGCRRWTHTLDGCVEVGVTLSLTDSVQIFQLGRALVGWGAESSSGSDR